MNKNLHDLSDDEFDDLFRESAEKADISFDPDAWKKMSHKLDAANKPQPSSGKSGKPLLKWGLSGGILLLLLLSGLYFFFKHPAESETETKLKARENLVMQSEIEEEKHVSTDKVTTENLKNITDNTVPKTNIKIDKVLPTTPKTDKGKSSKTIQNKSGNKDISKKEVEPTSENARVYASNRNNSKTGELDKKNIDILKNSVRKKTDESADLSSKESNTNTKVAIISLKDEPQVNNLLNKAQEITEKQSEYLNQKTNEKLTKEVRPSEPSDNLPSGINSSLIASQTSGVDSASAIQRMQWAPLAALSPIKPLFNHILKLPDIIIEPTFVPPIVKTAENTAFRSGINVRLALSPDFSFIPSNKIFKIGNNWAAIIEYRFNNRLIIQTGVIRSLKLYNALPNQYEWTNYYKPSANMIDIDATCKMLDIPLNLRYDISQKANSRWFVSGGLTSYIMLKEEYRYNYENPSDPSIKRTGWEGKTGAYPFSVFNVSAGYERQLFRRLTLQAEPFFKTPLGKVGYGKVRLATAGVFFSVKYPF